MDRIDRFVDQHKIAIGVSFSSIIVFPIVFHLLFSSLPIDERWAYIGVAVLYLMFGFIGMGLVLGIQVWNPFCSPRWLRFGCNFFLFFGAIWLLLGVFGQVEDFLKPERMIAFSNYAVIGFLPVAYYIRRRYCSDLAELPPIRSIKDAFKRPWIVASIFFVIMFIFGITIMNISQEKQEPLLTDFVREYNTGSPNLRLISDESFNATKQGEAIDILQGQFKERGTIINYKTVSTHTVGIGSGSELTVVYKLKYQSDEEPEYLKLKSIRQQDSTYKVVDFGFYNETPDND